MGSKESAIDSVSRLDLMAYQTSIGYLMPEPFYTYIICKHIFRLVRVGFYGKSTS